jgi:hypothetical protein
MGKGERKESLARVAKAFDKEISQLFYVLDMASINRVFGI